MTMSVNWTTVAPTSVRPKYNGYTEEIKLYNFVVRGILLIAMGTVGVIGNTLTVAVLTREEMRSSINCLLLGLAVSDTLLIISYVLQDGSAAICRYTIRWCYDDYIWAYLFPFVRLVTFGSQTMSVYLTLAVSVERWVAVCYPFCAKTLCTVSRARWCVLTIAAFALLYNVPRFLEFGVSRNEAGVIIYVSTIDTYIETETYVLVYEHSMYLVVMFIVPLTALVVLNACIVRQLRRARAERALLSSMQRQELGITRMLLVVVLIFCLCNLLPLAVNSIVMVVFHYSKWKLNFDVMILVKSYRVLYATSTLFVMTYSSVNFFIYINMGANFKSVFLKMFSERRGVGSARVRSPNKKTEKVDTIHVEKQLKDTKL